jgi:alpha-D-xyloside xylohydrolase
LLLDTGFKSYFDIGASVTDAGSLMNTGQMLDIYLFAGDSLKDITSDYTLLTGRIKGIPDKAYGI